MAAITNAQTEKQQLEQQRDQLAGETKSMRNQKARLEDKVSMLERYAASIQPAQEDLIVPAMKTNSLVKKAVDAIQTELGKPIPTFGQKEWKEKRRQAIKKILTELQTELLNAKEAQKQDILKLGKSLYNKAMQNVRAIIEQNKQLQKENGRLTEENCVLRKRIALIDENAIDRLRDKKDAEIKDLQEQLGKAEFEAVRSGNKAYSEHQRAEKAEGQIKEMLDVPEIRRIWDNIQQNKKDFQRQFAQWISDAVSAITTWAKDYEHNDFQPEQGNAIAMGIIAEAFQRKLDPEDDKQRMTATNHLLNRVTWKGVSDYMTDLTQARTRQLSDAMAVPQNLMKNLLLMAGGKSCISAGGGGSSSELTNWDGTKKKTGWGIS